MITFTPDSLSVALLRTVAGTHCVDSCKRLTSYCALTWSKFIHEGEVQRLHLLLFSHLGARISNDEFSVDTNTQYITDASLPCSLRDEPGMRMIWVKFSLTSRQALVICWELLLKVLGEEVWGASC
jgi:hypothetical protein